MGAHVKPLIHGQPTDPRSLPLLPIVKGCSCGHQGEYNDYGDRLGCYRCKQPICRDCNMAGGGWCKSCVDRDAERQAKRRVEP